MIECRNTNLGERCNINVGYEDRITMAQELELFSFVSTTPYKSITASRKNAARNVIAPVNQPIILIIAENRFGSMERHITKEILENRDRGESKWQNS